MANSADKAWLDAMLRNLVDQHEGSDAFRTLTDLENAHPEYEAELNTLKRFSSEWYGMTPVRYLKHIGLISNKGRTVDTSAHERLDATMTARNPAVQKTRTQTMQEHVRNAALDELVAFWKKTGGPVFCMAETTPALRFPAQSVGFDLSCNMVANVSIVCLKAQAGKFHVGAVLDYTVIKNKDDDDALLMLASDFVGLDMVGHPKPLAWPYPHKDAWDILRAAKSPLLDLMNAHVVAVSSIDTKADLVQVAVGYPTMLDADYMVGLLYENGLLTQNDLRGGDDWRALGEGALAGAAAAASAALRVGASAPVMVEKSAQPAQKAELPTEKPARAAEKTLEPLRVSPAMPTAQQPQPAMDATGSFKVAHVRPGYQAPWSIQRKKAPEKPSRIQGEPEGALISSLNVSSEEPSELEVPSVVIDPRIEESRLCLKDLEQKQNEYNAECSRLEREREAVNREKQKVESQRLKEIAALGDGHQVNMKLLLIAVLCFVVPIAVIVIANPDKVIIGMLALIAGLGAPIFLLAFVISAIHSSVSSVGIGRKTKAINRTYEDRLQQFDQSMRGYTRKLYEANDRVKHNQHK